MKILIIPHHPDMKSIKIRLIEIAKYLALNNDLYLLAWHTAEGKYGLKECIIASLKDLFKKSKVHIENGLNIVEIPTLHRPLWLVRSFNSFLEFNGY